MATFAELYCTRNGCPPQAFRRRIFWRTLRWRAVPFAPLLLLGEYFIADDELIDGCGRATRMQQICEEIQDHPFHPRSRGWLRRHAKVRVSTRRLRRLAESYLAKSNHPAPTNGDGHPIRAIIPGATHAFVSRPILPNDQSLIAPVSHSETRSNRKGFSQPPGPDPI